MVYRAGDTFFGSPGPLPAKAGHLWIIVHIYDDDLLGAVAVLVSVTMSNPTKDRSCVLNRGDHPYIAGESTIYYKAYEILVTELPVGMQPREPATADLLARVRQGLHASKFTPKGLKAKVPQK